MRCIVCMASQKQKIEGIGFHTFPKDEARRKAWLDSIGKSTFNLINRDKICSRHFKPEDFIQETSRGNRRIRPRLIPSAMPQISPDCRDSENIKENKDPSFLEVLIPSTSDHWRETLMDYENTDVFEDDPLVAHIRSDFEDSNDSENIEKNIASSFLEELQPRNNTSNQLHGDISRNVVPEKVQILSNILLPSTSADCRKSLMEYVTVVKKDRPLESEMKTDLKDRTLPKTFFLKDILQTASDAATNIISPNRKDNDVTAILCNVTHTTGIPAKNENLTIVDQINGQESTVIDQGTAEEKPKYVCDVFDCNRDSTRYPTISFHTFPEEAFKRSIWINFCDRESNWQPKLNSKVCSVHFHADDYEISLRTLKQSACPTMYVESIEQENDNMNLADTVQVEGNIVEKNVIENQKNSGISCSVSNCKNNYTTKGDTIKFHKFPISPTRRKIWAKFCLKDDKWKPNSLSRICSEHFELDDYLKTNLSSLKAKLKESACPSKYSDCNEPESKKRRVESESLLIPLDEENDNDLNVVSNNELVVENQDLIDYSKKDLIKENAELKATIAKLLKCNENLNANIESQLFYIETIENMCDEKNQRFKELELILKNSEENQEHTESSHSVEIQNTCVQPTSNSSINIDCKISKISTICRFCQEEFPSNTRLGAHMRKVHIKHLPFKCHLCVNCYSNQGELMRHLKKHPGMKRFACPVCKDRFEEWSDLQVHVSGQHKLVLKLLKGTISGVVSSEKKSCSVSGDEKSKLDYVQKNVRMKIHCNEKMVNSSDVEP